MFFHKYSQILQLNFLQKEITEKVKGLSRSFSLVKCYLIIHILKQWLQCDVPTFLGTSKMKTRWICINWVWYYMLDSVLPSNVTLMNIFINIYLLYVYMCVPECLHMYHICSRTYRRIIGSPEFGVTDGYEPLCGYCQLRLHSLQEQPRALNFWDISPLLQWT